MNKENRQFCICGESASVESLIVQGFQQNILGLFYFFMAVSHFLEAAISNFAITESAEFVIWFGCHVRLNYASTLMALIKLHRLTE